MLKVTQLTGWSGEPQAEVDVFIRQCKKISIFEPVTRGEIRCSWKNYAKNTKLLVDLIKLTTMTLVYRSRTNTYEGKTTKKRALDHNAVTAGYFAFYVHYDTGSDKLATGSVTKPREERPQWCMSGHFSTPVSAVQVIYQVIATPLEPFLPPFMKGNLSTYLPGCLLPQVSRGINSVTE